jgi:hypothetical protein
LNAEINILPSTSVARAPLRTEAVPPPVLLTRASRLVLPLRWGGRMSTALGRPRCRLCLQGKLLARATDDESWTSFVIVTLDSLGPWTGPVVCSQSELV